MNPPVLCAADDELAELLPNILMHLVRYIAVAAGKIPCGAGAVLAGVTLLGCAQTGSYAPNSVTASYRLDNFSKSNLQIVVRDLRAERSNSMELISAIQSQISNALTERPTAHSHYTLTVDVIEHRSFFTLGNWNASTRLKWRVQQSNGSILREGVSVGEGHRSNMAGYLTAGAVSQDAFNVAMADLMSSLSAIPTG
jgi:hypothetical protein